MKSVLVQRPRKRGVYVRCRNIDQCLHVVEKESKRSPAGTRITMLDYGQSTFPRLLALWHVGKRGTKRYRVNSRKMDRLIMSARTAFLHDMNRKQVIDYLVSKRKASYEEASLASAAGKILAKDVIE